jgi:Activator of Hsp90 ATPase homolog 1-like protein
MNSAVLPAVYQAGVLEHSQMLAHRRQRHVEGSREVADWPDGVYSIVRFELDSSGDETRLTLDPDGHPAEAEPHLGGGWHKMYREPLQARYDKQGRVSTSCMTFAGNDCASL